MNLGRTSFKLTLMQVGRAALLFAAVVYFARRLGPTELGSLFLFQALVGLLMIPADLGIRGALEKRLSEGDRPERMLGSALALKLVLLSIISVGILLARPYVNEYVGADLAVTLILALITFELSEFFIQTLRGEMRVGETALIGFSLRFVWVTIGIVAVSMGYGVSTIAAGIAVAGAVTSAWGYSRCETSIGRPSPEAIQSLIEYAKFHAIASTEGQIYQWIDVAVIGLFLSQAHVSVYEVSWQVTLLVLLVSRSIGWSIFPQISQWDARGERGKIEWVISKGLAFALLFSVPALIGGSLFAPEILLFLFGPEYVAGALVLSILLVEKLVQSFDDIIESALRGMDRPDLAAIATVVTVGINLVLNPFLVVTIGFVGAAIATTVAGTVSAAIHTYYLSRLVSIEVPFRLVGWYAVSSLVMGATLLGVRSFVPVTDVVTLFALIGFGATVYGLLVMSVPAVRNDVVVPAVRALT